MHLFASEGYGKPYSPFNRVMVWSPISYIVIRIYEKINNKYLKKKKDRFHFLHVVFPEDNAKVCVFCLETAYQANIRNCLN